MSANPVWIDCFDDEGKHVGLEVTDDLPGLLEEAALELELAAPKLSRRLFHTAGLLRRARKFDAPAAAACAIDSANCPGCGGAGCPACKC